MSPTNLAILATVIACTALTVFGLESAAGLWSLVLFLNWRF
jgi:hypothetical protein